MTPNADSGRVIGRPTEHGDDRISTALRLPADLHHRIKFAAEQRGVGVNWLMVRLLSESLDRLIPVEELRLTKPSSNGRSGP